MKDDAIPAAVLAAPPETRVFELWARLSRYSRYMAARYNGPVYLCGSVLYKSTPRDIDVRVEVADGEFCGRYGYTHYSDWGKLGPNQRWIDDMARRNAELAAGYRLNPDFQVYPVSHCLRYRKEQRVLVAAPTGFADHLADSTRWWDGDDTGFHL